MASSTSADGEDYHCRFCEYNPPTPQQAKAHLIGEHAVEIAAEHWPEHVATSERQLRRVRP